MTDNLYLSMLVRIEKSVSDLSHRQEAAASETRASLAHLDQRIDDVSERLARQEAMLDRSPTSGAGGGALAGGVTGALLVLGEAIVRRWGGH